MLDGAQDAAGGGEPVGARPRIPDTPWTEEAIFERLLSYADGDLDWRKGRTWAYIYDPGKDVERVAKRAYMEFLEHNGLDPTVYPSMHRIETDLAAMAAEHLRGDEDVVGTFTSGGTESLILAVLAARDYMRETRGITEPELVLPVTAHASFHKAAHYLGVKTVVTPADPSTFKADVDAIRDAITPNTIQLIGSATSYAHGVVDPIPEMGQLAREKGLLLHVDGCIGGFLLPYFRELGSQVTDFDFAVPGVTSISMDFHKYAFCPKGASILLHRSKDVRKHHFYACASWTGYTVINPTVQSTKSGGPLAAAWAVLHHIGQEGYLRMAKEMRDATVRIMEFVDGHPDIRLLGRAEMSLLSFASDSLSVFHVADEMKARGWYVQPQLGYEDSKENIHLSVTPAAARNVEPMLEDLAACIEIARGMPPGELAAGIGDAFADLKPADLDAETFQQMLGAAGLTGVDLPERMADINEVLNALPPPLKQRLLVEFLNELYQWKTPGT